MAEPLTYTELVRRVPKWLFASNRSLVDEMPVIIQEAEDQLMMVLDHDLFRTVIPGLVVGGVAGDVLDLTNQVPEILEVRAIRVRYREDDNRWTPLNRRDIEAMNMMFTDGRSRRPKYYAENEGILSFRLFPFPDREYQIEVAANVRPVRLGDDGGGTVVETNVLTEQYPRALEKAALRQACLFMKNYDDANTYQAEMIEAVNEANAQTGRRRRDEVSTRPNETVNKTGS